MPENNLVYEIARMMNDKPAIQNDFNEAANLVKKMFEEKYISRMNGLIKSHRNKLAQNPSREITLFQAFCAYMPEEERKSAEKLIDNLYMMETLSSIRNEYKSQAPSAGRENPAIFVSAQGAASAADGSDSSVHPDGVYDVDSQCELNMKNKPGAMSYLPIFLLLSSLSATGSR
jgi:hypothetical protein